MPALHMNERTVELKLLGFAKITKVFFLAKNELWIKIKLFKVTLSKAMLTLFSARVSSTKTIALLSLNSCKRALG